MARARGSASQILKRTSHIRIVLSDEIPIQTREARKVRREQEKKAAKKQTKSEVTESAGASPEKKATKPKRSTKPEK
jgi:large subunit ribosomal protein L22